jgi:hypothetical protein
VPLPDEKSHLSSNLKIRTWPLTDGYHKNSCMLPKLIGLILKTSCHSSENDFFPANHVNKMKTIFVVRFCYHRTIPMMRFAAYYGFHYWLQFELAAYNVSRNLARLVPV